MKKEPSKDKNPELYKQGIQHAEQVLDTYRSNSDYLRRLKGNVLSQDEQERLNRSSKAVSRQRSHESMRSNQRRPIPEEGQPIRLTTAQQLPRTLGEVELNVPIPGVSDEYANYASKVHDHQPQMISPTQCQSVLAPASNVYRSPQGVPMNSDRAPITVYPSSMMDNRYEYRIDHQHDQQRDLGNKQDGSLGIHNDVRVQSQHQQSMLNRPEYDTSISRREWSRRTVSPSRARGNQQDFQTVAPQREATIPLSGF